METEAIFEELVPKQIVLVQTNDLKTLAELGQKYDIKSIAPIPPGNNGYARQYNLLCCVKPKKVGVEQYTDSGKITEMKLYELIADVLGVPRNDLSYETNLCYDLGADSLDIVELITQLENALEIKISDRQIDRIRTVGDIVKLLKSQDLVL